MSQVETIIRHQLVINRLRRKACTWKEINDFLRRESEIQGYKLYVSQRTFQRDMTDIFSVYGIEIVNDSLSEKYKIKEEGDMDARHLDAFDLFNLLKMGRNNTQNVSFERRRPQGTEHLYGLLHALRNQLQVTFQYHKFYESYTETRKVEPYLLKEAKNRWYLICRDVEKMAFQGKYIKSLPLHESQEIISDTKEGLQVRLRMYVTYDFVMELLSYGKEVKVLQPLSLIEEISNTYKTAIGQYE